MGFVLVGDVIQYIASLVHLTALNRCRFASILLDCRVQRFAAIQNIEPRLTEIEPAMHEFAE